MTHIEIEHEPMGLIIRASGIVSNGECDNGGCDDVGLYAPYRANPRKWISLLDGLPKEWANVVRMNVTEAFYEELKTDIEWKEEQGRE